MYLKLSGLIIFFEAISENKISPINVLLRPLTISATVSSSFSFDLMSVIAYLKFKFILNVLIMSDLKAKRFPSSLLNV